MTLKDKIYAIFLTIGIIGGAILLAWLTTSDGFRTFAEVIKNPNLLGK